MEFIKKLCVCDKNFMRPDGIITFGFLVQESMREYRNIFDSNKLEPTDGKKI